MPGSATLNTSVLVDGLAGVIAELRGSLHPAMGVRPYRAYTVRRTWSGRTVGEGSSADVVVEITPQPRVMAWSDVGEFRYELEACGLDAVGSITLTEVDLSYTFTELAGPDDLGMNEQWLIKIGEAHGQQQPDRYFIIAKPPYVDREKDMGWVLWLRHQGTSR